MVSAHALQLRSLGFETRLGRLLPATSWRYRSTHVRVGVGGTSYVEQPVRSTRKSWYNDAPSFLVVLDVDRWGGSSKMQGEREIIAYQFRLCFPPEGAITQCIFCQQHVWACWKPSLNKAFPQTDCSFVMNFCRHICERQIMLVEECSHMITFTRHLYIHWSLPCLGSGVSMLSEK